MGVARGREEDSLSLRRLLEREAERERERDREGLLLRDRDRVLEEELRRLRLELRGETTSGAAPERVEGCLTLRVDAGL